MTKTVVFNPGKRPALLRDFGNIKVGPGQYIDLRAYKISEDRIQAAAVSGALRDELCDGALILCAPLKAPEHQTKMTEAKTHSRRAKLITRMSSEDQAEFIDLLQAEFGENILQKSDTEIAKNTEKLINTVNFDGFSDPLED